MTRIEILESTILKARPAYYAGAPIMTDQEFDSLERELEQLKPDSPVLHSVGYKSIDADYKHEYPMLSNEKALTDEALISWINKRVKETGEDTFIATSKEDGMSMSLHYELGKLVRAVSRGDGEWGTDKTAKMSLVVPVVLGMDYTGEVRGEVVISKSALNRVNAQLTDKYSNQRNAVAGILNMEDIDINRIKELEFRAFRLIYDSSLAEIYKSDFFQGQDTYQEDLELARDLGFKTVTYVEFIAGETIVEDVLDFFKELRNASDYQFDGVVFRVNDNTTANELGDTSHHPKAAIAWKFPSEYAEAIIKKIEWSVGTKDISPVAVFDPILIDGALVSRVSLKSVKNMIDLGVVVGCKARVYRSGGVIPWLKEVVD